MVLAKTIEVRDDLPRITAPTLVIKATLDRLATPAHSDELAAGIPGARLADLASGPPTNDELLQSHRRLQ
ncbi:hypothetical protein AFM11_01340 [Mycolicibacterium wolinskyi]|uniref:Uncharacterized protein n=1 Tax=Mycolicibacterium wolinskyi TaxID=59750 RepID=A0A132PUF2_9MYCO|nr:hypothetical protein AFM11_01340 [Mycolicibacterium wolinskyi]